MRTALTLDWLRCRPMRRSWRHTRCTSRRCWAWDRTSSTLATLGRRRSRRALTRSGSSGRDSATWPTSDASDSRSHSTSTRCVCYFFYDDMAMGTRITLKSTGWILQDDSTLTFTHAIPRMIITNHASFDCAVDCATMCRPLCLFSH